MFAQPLDLTHSIEPLIDGYRNNDALQSAPFFFSFKCSSVPTFYYTHRYFL